MKNLLFLAVMVLVPVVQAQVQEEPEYFTSSDFVLANQNPAEAQKCLAGAEVVIGYYHSEPQKSVLRMRNFIQGDCAHNGGNVVQIPGYPLRSYQHSTAWRYYTPQFDGQDRCGVLHFSGVTEFFEEQLAISFQDHRQTRCGMESTAEMVVSEHHSEGYSNHYIFLSPTPKAVHDFEYQ